MQKIWHWIREKQQNSSQKWRSTQLTPMDDDLMEKSASTPLLLINDEEIPDQILKQNKSVLNGSGTPIPQMFGSVYSFKEKKSKRSRQFDDEIVPPAPSTSKNGAENETVNCLKIYNQTGKGYILRSFKKYQFFVVFLNAVFLEIYQIKQ